MTPVSMVSAACRRIYNIQCTNRVENFLDNWDTSCFEAVVCSAFSDGTTTRCKPGPFLDPEGMIWAQDLVDTAVQDFVTLGYQLEATIGDPTYHPWADKLYDNVCRPYPVICQKALRRQCNNIDNSTRASQISGYLRQHPNLERWCGYWIRDNSLPPIIAHNITTPCTLSCNKESTVPLTDIDGQPLRCQSAVCVINDIDVQLKNSNIAGSIDVAQICSNCAASSGESSCSCIVNDLTLSLKDSIVGGNVFPVLQSCGSTKCVYHESGGNTIIGPCPNDANFKSFYWKTILVKNFSTIMLFVGITIALVIAILILLALVSC